MEQENKTDDGVQEAQVIPLEENGEQESLQNEEEALEPKRKRSKADYYVEIALFLILGVLVGVAIKNEAVKKITIGHDDYMMKVARQDYSLNQIQADLLKKKMEAEEEQKNQPSSGTPEEEGVLPQEGQSSGEPQN